VNPTDSSPTQPIVRAKGSEAAQHRAVLENGLPVLVAEWPKLPVVSIRLMLFSGGGRDPEGLEGLASATAELLSRGTRRWNADELNARMEELGGRLGVDAGTDSSVVGTTVPSENAAEAFNVLAEVAAHPRFAPAEVARAKRRLAAEIENGLDDPGTVAGRAIRTLAFPGHPYGRPTTGTLKSAARLSRSAVSGFHRREFGPKNAVLIVVGDLPAATAMDLADSTFGRWKSGAQRHQAFPEPGALPGAPIVVIHKPGATQVQVRVASRGVARASPEFLAGEVCATALGGLFTSRLMQALRVEAGLTYGASAWLAPHVAGGAVYLQSSTQTESVGRLIAKMLEVAAKARDPGISPDELERSRNFLCASFPFEVETSSQLTQVLGEVELFGLPHDYVARFGERMRGVTDDAVSQFARRYLPDKNFAVVAVGEGKTLAKQLEPFGQVRVAKLREFA
jgi:zinc protease